MIRRLAALAFIGLLFMGCGETIDCPWDMAGGRISGRVTWGGIGDVDATVTADRILDSGSFSVPVGEDGAFQLDVPEGDYRLRLSLSGADYASYHYREIGPSISSSQADTLRVDGATSPVIAEFLLGGMQVAADVDSLHDGHTCAVRIERRIPDVTGDDVSYEVKLRRGEPVDGRLELDFTALRPGPWSVQVILGGDENAGESIMLPGADQGAQAGAYPVGVDSLTHVTAVLDQGLARLQGRIDGPWRDLDFYWPPRVALFSADSVMVRDWQAVADDGTYEASFVHTTEVKVGIQQYGLVHWVGGADFAQATSFHLAAGQITAVPDHDSGALRLDIGWDPPFVFFPDIRLYSVTDATLVAETNDAQFRAPAIWLPCMAPGDYLLEIRPSYLWNGQGSFAPQWVDGATGPETARVITVAGGQITSVPVLLEEGMTLSGEIITEAASLFSGHVLVTRSDRFEILTRQARNGIGAMPYEITGAPSEGVRVGYADLFPGEIGEPPTGTILWYPGTHDWAAASVLTGASGDTLSGLDFDLR